MLQLSNLTIETAVANQSEAMEAETISKNGRSSKSLMSRGSKQVFKCLVALCIVIFLLSSCASHKRYFVKGEGGRSTVQIADRISYDLAFDEAISILNSSFELAMISKEAGYLRTTWNTYWVAKAGEKPQKDYRVRVTLRISEPRRRIDIHTEAEKLRKGFWIGGNDTRLLEIIRRDLSGTMGY